MEGLRPYQCKRCASCIYALKDRGPDLEVPSIQMVSLPKDWQTHLEVTRDSGTAWLEKKRSVLLQVPSAIVPETANFLFNPSHKQAAKFHIAEVFSYPFDLRLKT
jgi:RES domain-containing protein